MVQLEDAEGEQPTITGPLILEGLQVTPVKDSREETHVEVQRAIVEVQAVADFARKGYIKRVLKAHLAVKA
jgi:hypothetical protein